MASPRKVNVTAQRQRLRSRVISRDKAVPELLSRAAAKARVAAARARLRGSVLRYDRPLDPVIDREE
jgi:hypothetical protein